MKLLDAILYDPATAVSKSLATLTAMTAFDTTNLRLAITVPWHGKIRVTMRCAFVTGNNPLAPIVLLGVMDGATIRGRGPAGTFRNVDPLTGFINGIYDCDLVIPGLTPGAMTLDAAFGVENNLASCNIKYGGPNNATADNAWGGFSFEVWDPRPLPSGILKNTALPKFMFGMFDVSGDPKAGETVTATRSLDGAAFAACANSVVEIASGGYYIDIATTDVNARVVQLKFTSSGAKTQLITLITVDA